MRKELLRAILMTLSRTSSGTSSKFTSVESGTESGLEARSRSARIAYLNTSKGPILYAYLSPSLVRSPRVAEL